MTRKHIPKLQLIHAKRYCENGNNEHRVGFCHKFPLIRDMRWVSNIFANREQ